MLWKALCTAVDKHSKYLIKQQKHETAQILSNSRFIRAPTGFKSKICLFL